MSDLRLCFRYIVSKVPLLPKSEILSLLIFFGCAAVFVSDMVGNYRAEDRFSRDAAQYVKPI